jgi:hypothetical protein
MQATINHAQLTALQPEQSMAIRVRESGCLQPQAAFQHVSSSDESATRRAQQKQTETKRPMSPNSLHEQLRKALRVRHVQLPG